MSKIMVSIVIPVYNEEKILESAVENLKKNLAGFAEDFDFELIFSSNEQEANIKQANNNKKSNEILCFTKTTSLLLYHILPEK